MTGKKASGRKRIESAAVHQHQAGEGRCLDILRQLSAYIDDELPEDICAELRRHVGACPNCEEFIMSLRDTVQLCRHHQPPPLSAFDRARLRQEILRAWKPETRP
jgi:anti-sigma factor RsiW